MSESAVEACVKVSDGHVLEGVVTYLTIDVRFQTLKALLILLSKLAVLSAARGGGVLNHLLWWFCTLQCLELL